MTIKLAPASSKSLHRHTGNGGCDHITRLPTGFYRRRSDAPCRNIPGTSLAAIYNPSPLLNLTTHTPTHPHFQISHSRTPTGLHTTVNSARFPLRSGRSDPLASNADITASRNRTNTLLHPTPLSHPYITLHASILKLNQTSPSAPLYPAKIKTHTIEPYRICTLRSGDVNTASPSGISLPYPQKCFEHNPL